MGGKRTSMRFNSAVYRASCFADLDESVKIIQNNLGVIDGGYAGMWFSGDPQDYSMDFQPYNNWHDLWPTLTAVQREDVLDAYRRAQINFSL